GELVAKAGEPEGATLMGEPHDVVLVDGHTLAFECTSADHGSCARALGCEVVPPVVIAEDGVDTERSREFAHRGGPLTWADGSRLEPMARCEIAKEHNHIGVQGVGLRHDTADPFDGHGRAAGVYVGDDSNAEGEAPWPVAGGNTVACHL